MISRTPGMTAARTLARLADDRHALEARALRAEWVTAQRDRDSAVLVARLEARLDETRLAFERAVAEIAQVRAEEARVRGQRNKLRRQRNRLRRQRAALCGELAATQRRTLRERAAVLAEWVRRPRPSVDQQPRQADA